MKRFEKCIIDDAIRSKLIWILVCHHNKKQLDMSCFFMLWRRGKRVMLDDSIDNR